jgi:cytosine/uracil/thiamine/allantoin permease
VSPDDLHAFAIKGARGPYWFTGGVNFRAVTALVVGAVVGLMFSENAIFTGPLASALSGVDLSFISAGITGGVLYLIFLRLFPEKGVLGGELPAAPAAANP